MVANQAPGDLDSGLELDVRLDSASREGLTGTASSELYAPTRDEAEITTARGALVSRAASDKLSVRVPLDTDVDPFPCADTAGPVTTLPVLP